MKTLPPDVEKLHVSMQALSLLKYYRPIFPDDDLPFRAVAMALQGMQGVDVVALNTMREEIHSRAVTCHELEDMADSSRGWLVAARCAILLVEEALGDADDNTARELVAKARLAMVGVGAEA